ncbi:MAG: FHA domain-containing protein [Abditibacteriota bacterium]|nr:FHA domain-containing protein [Abditibacteriota bacterium]
MDFYKICPDCGRKNDPGRRRCACGRDLTRVSATNDEIESSLRNRGPEEPVIETPPAPMPVRVCPCGEKNPVNLRKCRRCGGELMDIPLTRDSVPEEGPRPGETPARACALLLPDGSRFPVTEATVLGREGALREALKDRPFVSRRHCELIPGPEGLFVRDLGSTNGTWLNGQRLGCEPRRAENGSRLVLAGDPEAQDVRGIYALTVEIK